jgi:hypothetical protein
LVAVGGGAVEEAEGDEVEVEVGEVCSAAFASFDNVVYFECAVVVAAFGLAVAVSEREPASLSCVRGALAVEHAVSAAVWGEVAEVVFGYWCGDAGE